MTHGIIRKTSIIAGLFAILAHTAVIQAASFGDYLKQLGGFSFGGYVQVRVANRLAEGIAPPRQLVLVGMAAGETTGSGRSYDTPALPKNIPALLIHGEDDDTVALANVLAWARPQEQPIIVIPGADHFFHGKLHLIRELIARNLAHA